MSPWETGRSDLEQGGVLGRDDARQHDKSLDHEVGDLRGGQRRPRVVDERGGLGQCVGVVRRVGIALLCGGRGGARRLRKSRPDDPETARPPAHDDAAQPRVPGPPARPRYPASRTEPEADLPGIPGYEVLVVDLISPLAPKTAPILALRARPPAGRPAPGPQCFRPVPTDPRGRPGEWGGGRRGLVRLEGFGARRSAVKSGW